MNNLTVGTSPTIQKTTVLTSRALNPPFIPDNATSLNIEVYQEPGSIISGFYTVTITTTTGETLSTVVDGQTMVLMLGAYISQNVEKQFLSLFEEVEKRNETIYAIQQLMPIIVDLQTKVPQSGSYTLTGADATTWTNYAAAAGLPSNYQGVVFTASSVTEILDLLQNSLSEQTRAGEQQMMELNTKASLRSTIYSLMQSNAAAFKQALNSAAGS